MITIEERATVIANKIYSGWDTERIRQIERGARMAATEQDRIARQEERERCIKAACEQYRKELEQIVCLMNLAEKGSGALIDIEGSVEDFRKRVTNNTHAI